jgi:delta 1-pyrroline-5-carboxylate dehydrogenase
MKLFINQPTFFFKLIRNAFICRQPWKENAERASCIKCAERAFDAEINIEKWNEQEKLLKTQAYINGQWTDAASRKTFNVTNPANGDVIAAVPELDREDVRKAIDAADATWPQYRDNHRQRTRPPCCEPGST